MAVLLAPRQSSFFFPFWSGGARFVSPHYIRLVGAGRGLAASGFASPSAFA
jgi:hypothetical protein